MERGAISHFTFTVWNIGVGSGLTYSPDTGQMTQMTQNDSHLKSNSSLSTTGANCHLESDPDPDPYDLNLLDTIPPRDLFPSLELTLVNDINPLTAAVDPLISRIFNH